MPQTFQVLKCYQCLIFQVHLTKKSNKWECKLCGEKQSLKRHYGIGTAQECRAHVQKLNVMQGDKSESSFKVEDIDSEDDECIQTSKEKMKQTYINDNVKRKSKWAAFIEENEDIPNVNNKQEYNEEAALLELPKKQKHKMSFKETSKYDEYSDNRFLNKKTCYRKNVQSEQCNENFITQNEIRCTYTPENGNILNNNAHNNYAVPLEIIPKTIQRCTKKNNEELEFNCNQFTKKTNPIVDYVEKTEKTTEISFERNIFRNDTKIEDAITFKNSKPDMRAVNSTDQGSKWSQFIDIKNTNDFKSDDKESHNKGRSINIFSLSDDKDLDSILEF